MSKTYDDAKKLAEELVELELQRVEITDKQKLLKEELLGMVMENPIDSMFECQNGLVFLESKTNYKIADGLIEETEVKSKTPEKISDDFIETYFAPDVKLNKQAKKAIKDGDNDLLAVLVPVEKKSIKIKTR